MQKWYADNSEMSTEKGKPNVLIFGGVIVDNKSEKQIECLLRDVKMKYTQPTSPIKWNFKDLEKEYKKLNRQSDYESLKQFSNEWRTEIFERSLEIDYTVVLACTERYPSNKSLKEELKKLKTEVKAELKQLDGEKETAIKSEVKQRFDYQIPIAEVEKAGIDSKGAKCENHLEPLRDEYNAYRKANNLWEEIERQSTYEIVEDTLMRMPIDGEPEMFYS